MSRLKSQLEDSSAKLILTRQQLEQQQAATEKVEVALSQLRSSNVSKAKEQGKLAEALGAQRKTTAEVEAKLKEAQKQVRRRWGECSLTSSHHLYVSVQLGCCGVVLFV